MAQSADARPEPTHQRKAAIAYAGPRDHRGKVRITSIPNFDLGRTIFATLEGALPRYVTRKRIGIEVHWNPAAAAAVQADYETATRTLALPPVQQELMRFLMEECDFDVEHAEGSFVDHLYFCYEYCAQHYPQGSPLVMLLHSILGTGTNTSSALLARSQMWRYSGSALSLAPARHAAIETARQAFLSDAMRTFTSAAICSSVRVRPPIPPPPPPPPPCCCRSDALTVSTCCAHSFSRIESITSSSTIQFYTLRTGVMLMGLVSRCQSTNTILGRFTTFVFPVVP